MKIIFSNYDDINNPFYGGGGAVAIHEVAKRLAKHHEVMVITGSYKNSKNETIDNVHYKRVGVSFGGPQLQQLVYLMLCPLFVLKEKHDLWIESFTPPISTGFLPLFSKKPVIGLTHFFAASQKEKQYHLPFSKIEKYGLKFYSHIIANTDELKQRISAINPKINVEVIPNAVDKMVSKGKPIINKPYILFLGRIEFYQKGLDYLLQAYKQIADKSKDVLVIAGMGQLKEEQRLRKTIEDLGLQDKVILTGRVTGSKKNNLLAHAKYLVMPSRYESQSVVSLEALAAKKAILCSDIEGLKWLGTDVALKFKINEIEDFSQKMFKLSTDALLRKKLSSHYHLYIKNTSWNLVASSYQKFIESIHT